MLIQLLPFSIGGLSQSIWDSAASALGTPLWPHISIDPGLTLLASGRYVSMAGIAFVAAAVSIERPQAEKLLLALASAAAAMSMILAVNHLGGFSFLDKSSVGSAGTAIIAAGIVGVVLFAASAIMIIEHYEVHHRYRDLFALLLVPLGFRIAGLVVCSLTFLADNTNHAIFAAASGLVTVLIIYFVRRIGLGSLAALAMVSVAIIAATAIISTYGHPVPGDISLRYMIGANTELASVDSRIISEVGPGGSGAGTFKAISILYGMHELPDNLHPSTFASQIAVELGRSALWVIIGLASALIFMFLRSAFNRGRDFSYPVAGAGVTVAMIVNSFTDVSLSNLAISLLVAVTLGLALGQSIGRTH